LLNFSKEVKKALLTCEVAKNIKELREKTKNTKWLIVSGGDQIELREVFKKRGLANYFDGGIFGSPDDKDAILKNEIKNHNINGKSLFLGDSVYDHQAATAAQMDFVFISQWTEVVDWEDKFLSSVYSDIHDLFISSL
jgi:phosphoglycolate phosphatase-like HAD superfamily hydrolase